jgi:hypothetical protein
MSHPPGNFSHSKRQKFVFRRSAPYDLMPPDWVSPFVVAFPPFSAEPAEMVLIPGFFQVFFVMF